MDGLASALDVEHLKDNVAPGLCEIESQDFGLGNILNISYLEMQALLLKCNLAILLRSVIIRDCAMHTNTAPLGHTRVTSVNSRCYKVHTALSSLRFKWGMGGISKAMLLSSLFCVRLDKPYKQLCR